MRDYYRHARVVDRAVRQAIEVATEKAGTLLGRFHEWRRGFPPASSRCRATACCCARHKPPQDLSAVRVRGAARTAPGAGHASSACRGFAPQATWADWKRLLSLPQAFGWPAGHAGSAACWPARFRSGATSNAWWCGISTIATPWMSTRWWPSDRSNPIADGRFAELMGEIEDPALVRFALLMHDIGKGSGRDHSEAAVDIARAVMERLGAPEADRETIEFLVAAAPGSVRAS